jgi:pimeloyl-ACP methyl ester carboxylesterase
VPTDRVDAGTIRLKSVWFVLDGLRCHARVNAVPPPDDARDIVLVHGYAVSGRYLWPLAELLAARHRVFVPDLPGYGPSDAPRRVPDVPELASFLERLMTAHGIETAVLVGNSFGSQIIAELARRAPCRASCLVLIGPTVDTEARSIPRLLWRLLRDLRHEPLSLWFIQARDYLRFGPRWQWRTARHMLRDHIEDKLLLVPVPVLLVRGERDPIAPARWLARLSRLAPDASLATIPDAGHAVNFSAPAPLADAVEAFLRATTPSKMV